MTGARTSTLANLRGRIERIEAPAMRMRFIKVALGHAAAPMRCCTAAWQ